MAGLNKGRQTHLEVPSSNEPLPSEWGKPMWYVCRLAALQAKPTITDDDARRLANYFECLLYLIPCPECRGHYSEYYYANPFTEDTARNTEHAMFWVEELRRTVDARIADERRREAPLARAPVASPATYVRKYAIKSALQVAQMNHAGRKMGCNCGKFKRK